MNQKTIFVIFNPLAAGGKCKARALDAIQKLQISGKSIIYTETTRKGHGIEIAKEAYQQGYRHFISIGGDGTHHDVINGLFPISLEYGEKPILQILPFGSGNSFVRDFINDPAEYDVTSLLVAKDHLCDVVRLIHESGELYFINILGIGFVAEVGLMRNNFFNRIGNLGYIIAVLIKTIGLRANDYRLRVDSENELHESATFITFNNSRYTGGNMLIAPEASVNDGFVDVIQAAKVSRFTLIRLFPKIFNGEHIKSTHVKSYKAKKIDFYFSSPVPIMIDGEVLLVKPIQLEVLPASLSIRI